MTRNRPSVRLVALLVYALVVNAGVWATGVAARTTMAGQAWPGSVICHGLGDLPLTPVAPAMPSQKAHACCDLACAGSLALAPPAAADAIGQVEAETAPQQATALGVLTTARARPWPTGPPAR